MTRSGAVGYGKRSWRAFSRRRSLIR